MENINSYRSTVANITNQIGQEGLNALYPNEFEYYSITLELQNSNSDIKDILIFPIMPSQISEQSSGMVNVKKSFGAVNSYINHTFFPKMLNIQGTFGRRSRLLIGRDTLKNSNSQLSSLGDNKDGTGKVKFDAAFTELSSEIKTGYGTLKLMEAIFSKSHSLDEFGKPHYLFFYNPSLNNNYLIEVVDYSFSQSLENNRMWNYALTIKTLANAESIVVRSKDRFSLIDKLNEKDTTKKVNKNRVRLNDLVTDAYKAVNRYQLLNPSALTYKANQGMKITGKDFIDLSPERLRG